MPTKFKVKKDKMVDIVELASDITPAAQVLRDTLKYGTPAEKEKALKNLGLDFDDLVAIHKELENIFHQSPLKFWWW